MARGMLEILQGQFFWGIVVGLLLSLFGGWEISRSTFSRSQKHQKQAVIAFVIDIIKNLQSIVADMDSTRDRAQAIHRDFLSLIDVEIGIYGRNREHLLLLPESTRNDIRKFMTDCALKRAEITQKLDQFYRLFDLADQILAEGRATESERKRKQADAPLKEAQKAADKMVRIVDKGSAIIADLSKL